MIPPLFAGLVDDAALFPPGDAPIHEAVPAHRRHKESWYGGIVGAFVCPDTRAGELTGPLEVSLILTRAAIPDLSEGVTLVAVETRGMPPDIDLPTYVEAPVEDIGDGHRAKLRTGGTTAAAFPSEAHVARYIAACAERKLVFKCTAGLHHAVRHIAKDTGFEHHGFLNVLNAVDAALAGATPAELEAILADRDESRVAQRASTLDASAVRALFTSFGSCSVTEPVDDLVRLGLLTP